jgi:hypothetical protein
MAENYGPTAAGVNYSSFQVAGSPLTAGVATLVAMSEPELRCTILKTTVSH